MGNNSYKPILVIGSIGMDQITKIDDQPQSGATKGGEVKSSPGGKGNNQAVACARAGGETAFIGVVGNNYNYDVILKKYLEDNNVKPILQTKNNEDCHIANITIDRGGMGKIVIRPGTDRYLTQNIIDKNIDIIEKSNIIIFDLEIPLETVAYAIDKCYEKKKIIILRPSFIFEENQNKLSEEQKNKFGNLIKKVNYLIVDEYELSIISGMAINSEDQVDKACEEFMKKNKEIQNLIVILKYRGCSLWNKDGDKKDFCSYYKKEDIVDFTGAVDCFIGVFAAFLSNKYKLDEAIKYANLAVSISAKKFGIIDTFPKLDEINKEKEKVNW
jgi:ribokinase